MKVRKLFLFTFLLLLAVAGWLAYGLLVPLSPGGQKFVMLRPGYSTRRIARELKSAGVIRSRMLSFCGTRSIASPSLKAGEYLFDNATPTFRRPQAACSRRRLCSHRRHS